MLYLSSPLRRCRYIPVVSSIREAVFGVFEQMILLNKDEFRFDERNRRPPTARVNALLSFTYTLLINKCCGA